MASLNYANGRFELQCSFADNELARRAGFGYDKQNRVWITQFAGIAAKVSMLAPPAAREIIARKLEAEKVRAAQGRATFSTFSPTIPPHKKLYPHQRAGIEALLDRPHALLADEMGCLSGGTLIEVYRARNIQRQSGRIFTYTLKTLYEKLNGLKDRWDLTIPTYARSFKGHTFGPHLIDKVLYQGEKETIEVAFVSGRRLRLTHDHEVTVLGGMRWVEAGYLRPGDRVLTIDSKQDIVESITPFGVESVYDIVMHDPYRNFAANGVIVHNCGKTPQAIAVCNEVKPEKVLIICPANLRINWAREWAAWTTEAIEPTIVSYNVLKDNSVALHSQEYDVLIVDECHYLKNMKAQRTQQVFGKKMFGRYVIPPIRAKRSMFLTGTPVLNRPIELYPLLNYLLPWDFKNEFDYAKRYCGATPGPGGWDFKGSSNEAELRAKLLATIMIRRLKKEVLLELPAKVRQVIELTPDAKNKRAIKAENKFLGKMGVDVENLHTDKDFRDAIKKMRSAGVSGFESLATVRRETALMKVPVCIEHLEDAIASSGKVVCFCYHTDVATQIFEHFGDKAVMLIGSTTPKKRQTAIDRFQTDESVALFVGNIQAAGVGITLTASSHVVFVELDWVPGNISQAEDRCHRIGQRDSVLVQHLVMSGSIDTYIARTIVEKQEVIGRLVDDHIDPELLAILA